MECLFCKILRKEIPSDIVFEDETVCAFNDINPQAPEHILIIPKRHISTINDIEASDKDLLGHMMLTAKNVARDKGLDKTGYRLVTNCLESAGQSVFHIHFHLLGGRAFGWPPG